jgi:hypothetical protein
MNSVMILSHINAFEKINPIPRFSIAPNRSNSGDKLLSISEKAFTKSGLEQRLAIPKFLSIHPNSYEFGDDSHEHV